MAQLDAELTPALPADVAGAFVWAYRQLFGKAPNKTDWLYPLAQSALETAHWAAMWNWNAGNVTTLGDYILLPGNPLHFKSYSTLGDGCLGMLQWLNAHGVMGAAHNDDLDAYVAALKVGAYLGEQGNYASYQAGIASYITKYSTLNPAGYINFPALSTKRVLVAALLAGGVIWLWRTDELPDLLYRGRAAVRRTFRAAAT